MKWINFKSTLTAIALVLCLLPDMATAQSVPKYSNTGTGNFTRSTITWGRQMFCNTSSNRTFQRVILPEELPGAQPGMIDSIYFMRYSNQTAGIVLTSLKIEILQTSQRTFNTTFLTGGVVARNSDYTIPTGNGNEWFGLPLTTPVFYDPTQTLVVRITYSGISGACLDMRTTLESLPGARLLSSTSTSPITGTSGNPCIQFGLNTIPSPGKDVVLQQIVSPQERCGESAASPKILLFNSGSLAVFDIPITFKATGILNGSAYSQTFTHTYTDTLHSQEGKIVTIPGSINTSTGGDLNFEIFVAHPNDSIPVNDTLRQSIHYPGMPAPPVPQDVVQCGISKIPLVATGVDPNDSCIWTADANGTQFIGFGKNTESFNEVPIGNHTYYAHTAKEFENGSLTTDFSLTFVCSNNYTQFNGGMFQVNAEKQALIITGLKAYTSLTASTTYRVYYKTGTFEGYQNTPSAWTQLMQETGSFTGGNNPNKIVFPSPITVAKGDSIAFYFTTVSGNDVYLQGRGVKKQDELASIITSYALNGTQPFGNNFTLANFGINMDVTYEVYCPSNYVPFSVNIKARPTGSNVSFDNSLSSSLSRFGTPDIVADADTLAYNITPPAGFANSQYGIDWEITSVQFVTTKGTVLPANQHVLIAPTGSTDAKVLFIPDVAWSDSTIKIYYTVKNLDPANQCDSSSIRTIFVAPRPNADFNSTAQCAGDAIEFQNQSSILSGAMTHEWDFGDGTFSNQTNPLKVYNVAKTYNVKLISTSQYGYTDTVTKSVVVLEKPLIDFKPVNACEGKSVDFINNTTLTGGGIITYQWDFGDGSPKDNTKTPSHTYANAGEYEVTLVAQANGCVSTETKNAFQFPKPTAAFTPQNTECNLTKEVTFKNNSTIASGRIGSLWDFGDGVYSTTFNTAHTFASAGVKTVRLRVQSAFGCIDSTKVDFTLKESPIAIFDNSQTCNIDPVEFINTSYEPVGSNVDYLWNFGDPTSSNNTSNLTNPSHKYPLPGTRVVTLTAIASNGCTDTKTKTIIIGVQPQAAFDAESYCEGQEGFFVNKTTISTSNIGVTYNWDFGDGNTSQDISPANVFAAAGKYNVTLVATALDGAGCTDTEVKEVTVYETPTCAFTAESNKSNDRRVNFKVDNPQSADAVYEWKFGDGGFSADASPQWQYTFDGGYFVTLRITNPGGCSCSEIKRVDINKIGTNDIALADRVSVYPNPSLGVFTVELMNKDKDVKITIYNSLGQIIQEVDTNNGTGEKYNFDISNQPAGVYTVKVQSGTEIYSTKITLTH